MNVLLNKKNNKFDVLIIGLCYVKCILIRKVVNGIKICLINMLFFFN